MDPNSVVNKRLSDYVNSNEEVIYLDHPSFLYLKNSQAQQYIKLMHQESYSSEFHSPLVSLIEDKVLSLVDATLKQVRFVDLGPGYPDKAIPILSHLRRAGIEVSYCPIDVNPFFLDLARESVEKITSSIFPIQSLFEEVAHADISKISGVGQNVSSIIHIGPTFMNYAPSEAFDIMLRMSIPGDRLIISTELLEDVSIESAAKIYVSKEVEHFNYMLLSNLGIAISDLRYFVQTNGNCIEMGFTVLRGVSLNEYRLSKGTQIVTATSRRYGLKDLKSVLESYFDSYDIYTSIPPSVAISKIQILE